MRALVVTGGLAPARVDWLPHYDRTIACDSGYDTAMRLGLDVDEVVGDLDSTRFRKDLVASGIIPCSHDKDESDTELALMRLPEGAAYDLIGGGGGRLDHLIALFASFRRFGPPRFWLSDSDLVVPVSGHFSFPLHSGCQVSFFCVGGEARIDCPDLVWPLDGFMLDASHVSLSNRTTGEVLEGECAGLAWVRLPLETFAQVAST